MHGFIWHSPHVPPTLPVLRWGGSGMVRVARGSFHPSVSCVFCSSLNFRWAGSSLLFLQHLCRLRSELILEQQKSGAISNLLRKELGKRQTVALWHAEDWALLSSASAVPTAAHGWVHQCGLGG